MKPGVCSQEFVERATNSMKPADPKVQSQQGHDHELSGARNMEPVRSEVYRQRHAASAVRTANKEFPAQSEQ